MTAWQWLAAVGGVVITIAGIIKAIRELINHNSALRAWLTRRRRRREKLDKLIESDGTDCRATCNRYAEELGDIGESLTEIKDDLKEIKKRNEQQDKEIDDSLEEREIHSKALFALLDGMHQQGLNGPVSAARDDLKTHLLQLAHRKEYL